MSITQNVNPPTWRFKGSLFPLLYSGFIGGGMSLCLALSIYLHYRSVTKNHCRVWEFWPSVSASIGDYSPEKNIWRAAIALGFGPRIISAVLNYNLFKEEDAESKKIEIGLFMDVLRVLAAAGWTYISSSEYLFYHEICFVIYIVFSLFWCGFHTYLFKKFKINHLGDKE
jgi:hypothetical protein